MTVPVDREGGAGPPRPAEDVRAILEAEIAAIMIAGLRDMVGKPISPEMVTEATRRVTARVKILPQLVDSDEPPAVD